MNNTKSPTATSSPNALFHMGMPEPLSKPCAVPLPSWSPTLRQTRYLLATPAGWILDHSKKPADLHGFYTHRFELALSYSSLDAAAERATSIQDLEPDITVMPVELICDASTYPFGWRGADD